MIALSRAIRAKGIAVIVVAGLLAALVATSMLAWLRLATMSEAPVQTSVIRIAQIQRVSDVRFGVSDVASQLRLAVVAKSDADVDEAVTSIAAARKRLDRTLGMWQLNIPTPTGQQRFESISALIGDFWKSVDMDLAHLRAGQRDEAMTSVVLSTTPILAQVYTALESERERQGQLVSINISGIAEMASDARFHLIVWVATILGSLVAFFFYVIAALRRKTLGASVLSDK